jgi:hypothetical protein
MAKAKDKTTIDTSRYEYARIAVRGADGKMHYSAGNGDAVAKALLLHCTVNGKALGGVIRDNGLASKFKDAGGNAGTLRMSVGVALRALVKAGTPVTIGDVKVSKLSQKVELPKPEKAAPRAAKGRSGAKRRATAKTKKAPRARKPRAAAEAAPVAAEAAE